jgi:hypothetical protein
VSPAARQPSAEKQFAGFLAEFTPDVAATARAAPQRLRKQVPPAIELVYDNYNGLVVGFGPSMHASEAVLSLAIFPTHVPRDQIDLAQASPSTSVVRVTISFLHCWVFLDVG